MSTPIRSFLIDRMSGLMNWVDDHVCYDDLCADIGWRDRLRWWLDGLLMELFALAYRGSDEELLAVDHDEIPVEYMSQRQLDYWLSKMEDDL